MTHALVSICMPIYAPRAEHVSAAISSVQAQTEQRWTLQIREDQSETDASAIVTPFLTDPRITYVRNPTRLGIGGNWNACLREAVAPYVQYLFQDDVWEKTYLEHALAAMEAHPQAGLVAVPHRYAFEGEGHDRAAYDAVLSARAQRMPAGMHAGKDFLLKWMEGGLHPNLIGEPSFVMIRRNIAEQVGWFDETMPQSLDAEYWTRCLLHADLCVLAEDGGMFRVHASGASAQNNASGSGLFDRLTTMQRVVKSVPASDRSRAKRALADAITPMARKFLERRKKGGTVNLSGSGALKTFALRHPFLMLKALLKAFKS